MTQIEEATTDQLEGKLKFLIRWVFSDILVNLRSSEKIWKKSGLDKENVFNHPIELTESNIGTLQLICVGIETFGRVALGEKDNNGVSEKCFKYFIQNFFPQDYKQKSGELYKRYRCSLTHSHILGYKSTIFPNRKNRNPKADHLFFTDEENSSFNDKPDNKHLRMIIDIDKFYCDFKLAVETFSEQLLNKNISVLNAEKSLEDIPIDQ